MTRILHWWDGLNWWHQIMIGAALVCVLEIAVLTAAYPWLERMVTHAQ